MRRYSFLTCLLIVLASVSLAWAQTASKGSCPDEKTLTQNARMALVEAQKLMTEKKPAQAEKILTGFLQKHPDENHAFVVYTLAACYLDLNKFKSALEQYEKTIDFCPAYAPAWQNLGKICFDLKKYTRAGTALEKAWELTGRKNHLLRFHAAVAYISAKKQRKALPILTDLCSGKTGPPEEKWVKLLVQTAVEVKQPKAALRTVERLLNRSNPDAYLFRLASVLYLESANYRKAAQNLEAYSLVATLSRQERKLLADLYVNLGIPSRAAPNYAALVAANPCARLWERTAACWFEACDYDHALEAAQKGLVAYPKSPRLWRIKGWVHYENKDYSLASQAFGKASGLDHKDINSLFLHGLCACRAGDINSAKKALEKVACHDRYKARALGLIHEMEEENI
ncbi:tetratricopeptide repeat protein [Desulfobacter curvatus]|uniref:tetratricopeptide repeat protein n=1 Tax=Desulfobacter curvatus TaxID=2290 RepID=UPI000366C723|nr:tetratricopeptide repeat protein [Desulfobacter curvatus]